ncbi:MAG: hypothetical protein ACJ8GW_09695 [Massilia sp.]
MANLSYQCSSCRTVFEFAIRAAYYHVGELPLNGKIKHENLLAIPTRPAWCKDCDTLAPVEDIASLRDVEHAFGALKIGKPIAYPFNSENLDPADAIMEMKQYLAWRMQRRHPARVLCCGGMNFQCMDVAQPLFKHAECDFGVIEPVITHTGAFSGPGPGVYSVANTAFYDTEGALIGELTSRNDLDRTWEFAARAYPPQCGE